MRFAFAPSRVGFGGLIFLALIHACRVARVIPTFAAAPFVVQISELITGDTTLVLDTCQIFVYDGSRRRKPRAWNPGRECGP
jgi:hypothetical protein